ncbi:1-acyl-sn-glycerol-3-phosphate acyltransferase epsilon [Camelus dromedarius]|uniref:1-acyl-sn-glycerol-3-phosphate acyltransferase epsilon n=1 Tax=Camelus dromedarius TaxID=9838 RepID=A0A5N4CFB7_CAMDR|nr:1-acyl-sn-glycerol-3-phosphate acyltransferase epsilon [Camelus dromedarius]
MLLSLVLHMYSMRCVLPAAVLLGTAPTYVLAWGAWRLLSAFLPSRFYQAVDDRLYCIYQSMVLFFFENYTGVQVRLCLPSAPARRTCRPSLPLAAAFTLLSTSYYFEFAVTLLTILEDSEFAPVGGLGEGNREKPGPPFKLVSILLYGDLPKNKENIIYLANHQSTGLYLVCMKLMFLYTKEGWVSRRDRVGALTGCVFAVDWIIADILAIRQNALGHVRYVLKDGLKWLPLYGCYFSQHGGIYVKRSAKFNEKEMRRKLQRYMDAGTPVRLRSFLLSFLSTVIFLI